ncbi:MAG: hypothetical protein WKF88_10120 [Ferruginibacter sp.]
MVLSQSCPQGEQTYFPEAVSFVSGERCAYPDVQDREAAMKQKQDRRRLLYFIMK